MASNNTFVLEFKSSGSKLVIKQIEQSTGAIEKNTKAKERNQKQGRKRSIAADKVLKQQKGIEQGTLNSTKAFSKLSQQLGGIVPIYAQVAANVFAITAAFGALERAADFGILTDAAAELEVQTGRSLTGIATSMKAITGEAISMKEALTQASIAASAGFDNTTIERLTQVSRNASVALGREMTDALNRVFKGAIKAEPELLDELGIILRLETAANKYAQSLNKTAKDLTTFEKQQAVVNEVLEQGEEKFGRLSKVDPNPYTLLSSAFADITVNMLNFISSPIGEFIGFLSKNTESLTAIIILLSSSILKMSAGPINDLFQGLNKSIIKTSSNLGSLVKTLTNTAQKLNNFSAERKVKSDKDFADTRKIINSLGTSAPPSLSKIFDSKSLSNIQKINKGLRAVNLSLNTMGNSAQNADKKIQLSALRRLLEITKGEVKESTTAIKGLGVVSGFAGKGLAFLTTQASAAAAAITVVGTSTIASVANILAAEGAAATWIAIKNSFAATSKISSRLTRNLAQVGVAFGSLGATIFKMIPGLAQITIAWQILSGIFSSIKDAFDFGDVARLTESLEDQAEQLDSSAEAINNYEQNLIRLPTTLANTKEQLTLQSNVLAEMVGSITKVNTAIKKNDGFSFFSGIADFFSFGDQDATKENISVILGQLEQLGLAKSLTPELRDMANAFSLSGDATEIMAEKFEKFLKVAQRASNGAKEANQNLIDSVEEANKASSSLFGSLPSLDPIEKSFAVISNLASQLDSQSIEKTVDALAGLSSAARKDFGIDASTKDLLRFNEANGEIEAELKRIKPLIEGFQDNLKRNGKLFAGEDTAFKKLLGLQTILIIRQEEIGNSIADHIDNPLKDSLIQLEAMVDNAKNLKTSLATIDLKKLNTQNTSADTLELLKREVELKNNSLDIDRNRSKDSNASAIKEQLELTDKILQKESQLSKQNKAFFKDKLQIQKIETEIGNLNQQKTTQLDKELRTQKALEATDGKKFANELKFNKAILKDRTKIADLASKGGFGEQEKLDVLNDKLRESNRELADLNGNSKTFADSITNAQIEATKLSTALQEAGVSSNSSIINATDSLNSQTDALGMQLELSSKLNDTLFLRADAQGLIRANAKQAELDSVLAKKRSIEEGINNGTKDKVTGQASLNELVIREANLKSNILSIQNQTTASLAKQSEVTIQNLKSANKFLKQEIKFGTLVTKQDAARLKIAQLRDKLKGNGSKDIERIIKLTKEQIKLQRKLDFSKEIRKGAQAMNDLADGMNRVIDAIDGGDSIEKFSSGLILIQDIGDSIGGALGNATTGLATFSQSLIDTSINLELMKEKKDKAYLEGDGSLAEENDFYNSSLGETQALLIGSANALGALSSVFEDGSDAAKAFTLVQHGLAIASAAVAVSQAGQGPPPTGLASAAAMLSLLTSVLGAAGIAFGGGSATDGGAAEKQAKKYTDSVGEQGLVGRDLVSISLIDGIDSILSIDNLLYGETRKMVNHLASLNDSFSLLAASLFTQLGKSLSGLEFSAAKTDLDSVSKINGTNPLGNVVKDVAKFASAITLGLTDLLGGSKVAKELSRFFGGKTTITQKLLDKGLEFEAAIGDVSEGLSGTLETEAFNVIQSNTKRKRSFGRSTKFSSVIDTFTAELEPTLTSAFDEAFDSVLKGIELTTNEFTKAIPNLDPSVLFRKLEGFKLEEKLSLEGLEEDEVQEAITAFFSAATDDIVQELFPFIEKFRQAGESISGTFFRITADIATVDNALSFSGSSIAERLGSAFNDVAIQTSDIDIDAHKLLNSDGISSEIKKQLNDLEFISDSDISQAISPAAAQFSAEFTAVWVEEVLSHFGGDANLFAQQRSLVDENIFSEQELTDIKDNRAFNAINQAFTDLLSITEKLGRKDLSQILLSGTLSAETVRKFEDLARATGAFAAVAEDGSILGGSIEGIIGSIGGSLQQLRRDATEAEEAIEEVFERSLDFVREIALFGLPDKDSQLLQTAFDYQVAIQAAREAGDDLGAVEIAFGLRRINIVKEAFEEIEEVIQSSMTSVLDATIQVASSSKNWDSLSFSIFKINKLVSRLRKGINGTNLSSLIDSTDGLDEFTSRFKGILDSIENASPSDIKNEIQLVTDLKDEILSKYELERELIQEVEEDFQEFAIDIKGFLDNLFLSDLSPLTNFEQLNEAEKQFQANIDAIKFGTEEEKAAAIDNILQSSTNFLEQASEFFAIGPAYQAVFDRVTSSLDSLGLDFDKVVADTSIEDKLEELNAETLAQLSVLDDVLDALERNNLDTLAQDVGNAVTEGLLAEIKGITHKLGQLGDDGVWNLINQVLKETKVAAVQQTIDVITSLARYDVDKLTGFITTAIGKGFGGVNVRIPTPQVSVTVKPPIVNVIVRQDPRPFVPGTPTEADPTTGGKAPTGVIHNPRPEPLPPQINNVLEQSTISYLAGIQRVLQDSELYLVNSSNELFTEGQGILKGVSNQLNNIRGNLLKFSKDNIHSLSGTIRDSVDELFTVLTNNIRKPTLDNISDIEKLVDQILSQGTTRPIVNRSFDVGTPSVPQDMLANVHRGEMIIPETFAQGIRSGSLSVSNSDTFVKDLPETLINELRSGSINLGNTSDNEDVIQAIRELTEVLAVSQEDLVDIANKNSEISEEIASSLQGNRRTTNTAGVA